MRQRRPIYSELDHYSKRIVMRVEQVAAQAKHYKKPMRTAPVPVHQNIC